MTKTAIYGLHKSTLPNADGNYGEFGGKIQHPTLAKHLQEIEDAFHKIIKDESFISEMKRLRETFVGIA